MSTATWIVSVHARVAPELLAGSAHAAADAAAPAPSYCTLYSTTESDAALITKPSTMKSAPMPTRMIITQVGVRIGCQACAGGGGRGRGGARQRARPAREPRASSRPLSRAQRRARAREAAAARRAAAAPRRPRVGGRGERWRRGAPSSAAERSPHLLGGE